VYIQQDDEDMNTPLRSMRIPDNPWKPAMERATREGTTLTAVVIAFLRRYAAGATVLVLTAVLAGCGGGDTAEGVDYTSARAIATALDAGGFECTGWTPNVGVVGASEDGWCTHGEGTVSVATFDSAEQMQAMNDAVAAFASGAPVQGEKWQVSSRDEAQAAAVHAILGGDVQWSESALLIARK
jgi:hypothetical protein